MNRVPLTIWTVGHSTHPIAEFLDLLTSHGIRTLADVRRFPTSRWPQFKREVLRSSLSAAGIDYVHIPELGGYRKGGYESHAQTAEFAVGIRKLAVVAESSPTAIMCAEAVFFRCHRRYIADALVRAGDVVTHIYPDGRTQPHRLRETLERYA